MISAVFRRGGDVSFVVEELKAVFDPRGSRWYGGKYVPSLLEAIGGVIAAGALGIRQTLVLHMNTFYWGLSSQETGIIMVMTLILPNNSGNRF